MHAFSAGAVFGIVIIVLVVLGVLLSKVDAGSEGIVVGLGTVLALVGFFLPWYWVSFSPPHGSAIVDGGIMKASTFTESGLSTWSDTGGKLLWIGIFASVPIAISYLPEASQKARGSVKMLHASVQLIVCMAVLAFVWLQLAFWNTGFRADFVNQEGRTQSALDASQYVSGHLGLGFILLTLGVIIVSAVVIKQMLVWMGLLLILVIVLAIFSTHDLGVVFRWLEFPKNS